MGGAQHREFEEGPRMTDADRPPHGSCSRPKPTHSNHPPDNSDQFIISARLALIFNFITYA
jgi:hypothetical protein